ncbi:MAG: hypothetical protein WCJ84_00655 [Candidatus Peregrinibacteria bacterium]
MKQLFFSLGFILLFCTLSPVFADFSSVEEENVFLQITNLLPSGYKESFLGEYQTLQSDAASGAISERKAQQEWKILRTKVIGIYRVNLLRQAQQNTELATVWAGTYESYTEELGRISLLLDQAETNFLQEYFGNAEKKLSSAKNRLQNINQSVQKTKN